ncbi:MAG TPA: hypothetical protein VFU06_07220 [Longimicrobiales bacterium]|nr:hypothetical protein [Longimicrobiales bacterium]
MRCRIAILLCCCFGALPQSGQAQAVSADYLFHRGVVALSVFGGGIAFSDFRREAEWLGPDQPFEQRLSASTSVLGSAAVSAWLGRRVAVRVQGAWTPTRFELRSTETYTALGESNEDTAPTLSRLDVWMYDVDLLFRLPLSLGRVEPYAVAGLGAIEYRLRTGEEEVVPEPAEMAFNGDRQRRLAGVLGVGAVIPLERHRLLLNFELSSHIARTPISESAVPRAVPDPEAESRVDEVGYTSGVRLMIGLTVPLFTPGS